MKTISVIWPTTEVFNRVGHCDVIISSVNNVKNKEIQFTQQLQFDTRFTQIDPTGTTFRRQYHECLNWDMNFLSNCTPVSCEEKYFGKRNFYNTTTKMCEPAPRCDGEKQIYDIYSNECLNVDQLMNPEDIENIKRGHFENNTLDPVKARFKDSTSHAETKRSNDHPSSDVFRQIKESPMWSEVLSGLTLVLATIVIYTSVCFCIFLLVNWLSKRPDDPSLQRKM